MPVRRILILLLITAFMSAFAIWRVSKARCFQLVGEVTCRVETGKKIVALSFDDGPMPRSVAELLPMLDRYDVKATFFLIGKQMKRHPGLAEKIHAAGHEVGNHSYHHQRNLWRSSAFYKSEIEDTDRVLKAAGISATLFRPPFGKRLTGLPIAVENAGYRMVTWDVAGDPEHSADYAVRVLEQVKPGSIILIHPMHPHNRVERDAVPSIIEGLRARGYKIVTVGELLKLED